MTARKFAFRDNRTPLLFRLAQLEPQALKLWTNNIKAKTVNQRMPVR